MVLAFPVIDPPAGDDGCARLRRVDPHLLARGRIQRDDRIVVRENEHDSIHDNRVEVVLVVVSGRIGPGDFEFTYIGAIDLS